MIEKNRHRAAFFVSRFSIGMIRRDFVQVRAVAQQRCCGEDRRGMGAATRHFAIQSGLILAVAAPCIAAPAGGEPDLCRLVAGWDAERDLVAYEDRRGDCDTPPPALTG